MERLLVVIDGRNPAWEALQHALCLAGRVAMRVQVLFVVPPGDAGAKAMEGHRHRLDLAVQDAGSRGVGLDYFVAEGALDREVIDFVARRHISLLVAGPVPEERGAEAEALMRIVNAVDCRVEFVSQKRTQPKDRP